MHQEPEHEDYDDDEHKFYPENKPHQFKFDWQSWEEWLKDTINELQTNDDGEWIINYYYPSKQKNEKPEDYYDEISKKFLYFGQNQYDESIWKAKFFIKNHFNIHYQNHFMSHAVHIIKQPAYYRGLFDMLN